MNQVSAPQISDGLSSSRSGTPNLTIEALADALPAIIWITDPNGTLSFVNRYALEYLRFPELDLLALDFPYARTNAARQAVPEPWRAQSWSSGQPNTFEPNTFEPNTFEPNTFETETIITDRHGIPRRFLTRCRVLHDAGGRIKGYVGLSLPVVPDRVPGAESLRPESVRPASSPALRETPLPCAPRPSPRSPTWLGGLLAPLALLGQRVRPEES